MPHNIFSPSTYLQDVTDNAVHEVDIFQVIQVDVVVAQYCLERYNLMFLLDVVAQRMVEFLTLMCKLTDRVAPRNRCLTGGSQDCFGLYLHNAQK